MQSNTTVPAQHRQGDVMIARVDELPAGLKKVPTKAGRIVLALGKANNRSHVIQDTGSELLQDKDGNRFLRVKGKRHNTRFPILSDAGTRVLVKHPEHGTTVFVKTEIKMPARGGRPEIGVDGPFAFLRHDCAQPDHNALAISAGNYRVIRQREFSQGDVRNVID